MQLTTYTAKQYEIRQYFQQLKIIAQILQLNFVTNKISTYLDIMNKDRFNLVVVGNFSRGKSTFIDALMGRKILPVSKKPTTAVISKISYNDTPRFIIHYKAGESKKISEEEFYGITAPNGVDEDDPADVRAKLEEQAGLDKIDFAEIGYPLDFCRHGVDLVDTPGTNDMSEARVQITYGYLNHADAVIMVLAANQVLTAGELDFLKERILNNQIQDVFFVVNYKDQVVGEEESVLDYLHTELKKILPKEMSNSIKTYLVSSYQALLYRRQANGENLSAKMQMKVPEDFSITGFNEFEEALGHFLANEKGQRRLEGYVRKGNSVIADMLKLVNERIEVSKHSADEIRAKVAELEPRFRESRQVADKLISDMKFRLDGNKLEIINRCTAACGEMLNAGRNAIDDYSGRITASGLKSDVNRAISYCQKKFIDQMTAYKVGVINSEYKKINGEIKRIWTALDTQYSQSFNLPAITSDEKIELYVEDEKRISDSDAKTGIYAGSAGVGLLLGGALLPALALGAVAAWCFGFFNDGKERIKSDAKRQLSKSMNDISKNIQANVIKQYDDQVNKLCQNVKDNIEHKISDMEQQLNLILKEKQQKENEQQIQLEFLNAKKREINSIADKLQGMI